MGDYKAYLKAAVISDGNIVTYRQLSRVLKVHVNRAKEMLYDFYADLSSRKSGTIHATYIISGLRKPSETGIEKKQPAVSDEDELMQSSPFDSSIPESKQSHNGDCHKLKPIRSVVLTPEEKLKDVKASFEIISSIHIYSVEPTPLNDLMILSDSCVEVQQQDLRVTPAERCQVFGTIVNPMAKHRTGTMTLQPTAPVSLASDDIVKIDPKDPKRAEIMRSIMEKKRSASSSTPAASGGTESRKAIASTMTKRSQTDFFKQFSGTAKKGKEQLIGKKQDSPKQHSPEHESVSTKMDIDEPEANSSPINEDEDEDDEEEVMPFVVPRDAVKEAEVTKSRREREEALRRMMDSDEEQASPPKSKSKSGTKREMLDNKKASISKRMKSESPPPSAQKSPSTSSPELNEEIEKEAEAISVSQQIASVSQPSKRRGRRKVSKKFHTKDKGGYLVTRTETVWESFSEDETPALAPTPKPKTATLIKGKGGPKGQGNIMNFFTKK